MALANLQQLKTLKPYVFNKMWLIVSISVSDVLLNVILSEVCSKKYNKDETGSLGVYYNYNISCHTIFNNEDDAVNDVEVWETVLTRKNQACLTYLENRFCSTKTSTNHCFPISMTSSLNCNSSLKSLSKLNSQMEKVMASSYILQSVQVCVETSLVTIKNLSVCSIQYVKDNVFRILPIIAHSASFIVLVKTPDMRLSYGKSVLFYVTCLLGKAVFNVVVVARVLTDYTYVCIGIGVALHISWLFSEAWQIVISYQIWSSFKSGLGKARCLRACPVLRDRIDYHPLPWILPSLIVLFTLGMDFIPGVPEGLRPGLGACRCWFIDERTRMIYASLPAALAEVFALILFVATLCNLRAAKALSKSLQTIDSTRHCSKENQWISIYVKVSFLTGASYILVTLFGLYTLNYKKPQGVPSFIINTVKDIERFRGFEIFYIFVLNKKNFLHLSPSSSNEQSARNDIATINLRTAESQLPSARLK